MLYINDPLVSIVIPCLNRAHYLAPTIDSILQQDYSYVECIVVDGGSTDETLDILKSYGNRITWISEPDNGHADAINKGWRKGKGDIITWLNADDMYVVPDAVSQVVEFLKNNPQVDVVYGDYTGISRTGKITSGLLKPREWDLEYAVKYCIPIILQPSSFIRRSIVEKAGWLDENDDHWLWLRIGLVGKIKYAPIHIAHVRRDIGLRMEQYISESKVVLTRKFFEQPGLSAPFNEKKFKKRAISNAYVIAAIGIWSGSRKLFLSLKYLFKALSADILNSFHAVKTYLAYFIFYLFPVTWQEKIRGKRWRGIQGIAGGSKRE
ncbi:MAG: glycosyltransferase [Candidatus Latescibacteria bacterium]|jgi:glycosyltransferase involved in cell wall biosynthesis|nr:glycosyltransferase [Candidatus Latescibacterota bacterium]